MSYHGRVNGNPGPDIHAKPTPPQGPPAPAVADPEAAALLDRMNRLIAAMEASTQAQLMIARAVQAQAASARAQADAADRLCAAVLAALSGDPGEAPAQDEEEGEAGTDPDAPTHDLAGRKIKVS